MKMLIKIDSDINVLNHIFDVSHDLAFGEKANVDGNAVLLNLSGGVKGIDASQVISFVIDNLESVASGIFSAYLYDKLKSKNIRNIFVDDKKVEVSQEEIKNAIDHKKLQQQDEEP